MTMHTYDINGRPYTYHLPLAEEMIFDETSNYLFDLSYLGLLSIQGEKASDYLQGQLSCDVRQVNANEMRHGLYCNVKGRILAIVDLIQWQGLHLILPHDLMSDTTRSLEVTARLSHVALHPTLEFSIFGFYQGDANGILPLDQGLPHSPQAILATETHCVYCIFEKWFIFIMPKTMEQTIIQPFQASGCYRGSLAWHTQTLLQHRLELYPQTRGVFLPHRLAFHLSGYIHFEKGCYKGQEIIARMHYKGNLKHGLFFFTIFCKEPLSAGQQISDHTGTNIGELIDYAFLGENHWLVAVSMLSLSTPTQIQFTGHHDLVSLI